MPTIKIACPECGQRVSGDESFLGRSVKCPACDSQIPFPDSFDAPPEVAAAEPPPLPEAPQDPEPHEFPAPSDAIPSPPSEHINLQPPENGSSTPDPDSREDSTEKKVKTTVFKIACKECGQRVSGDDSFLGTTVPCPNCGTEIVFPDRNPSESSGESPSQIGKLNVVNVEKPKLKDPDDDDEDEVAEVRREPRKRRKKAPAKPLARAGFPAAPASAPASAPVPAARVSKVAVWALIFGLCCCVPVLGLLFLFPALLLGHTARGRIKNSGGRLLGKGLATTGLVFTYLAVVVVIFSLGAALALKGKDRATQFYNVNKAPQVLEALNAYAETHQGTYPAALEDLVPDYIPREQKYLLEWIAPSNLKPVPYLYYPGHDLLLDDAATVIIAAPEPDALNRRLVGYLSSEATLVPDEEFRGQMGEDEEDQDE
jgi:DNA-directed RNA polymerase subunit RPC12/RpoP